ncbi:MAG: cation diffusion facilitator family transporter [Gammaproteobacteria bacterium]|nr:cation diffusion facilitator family transporter [Gammaproteobacteria bacterium]MDH5593879.1 cation diffusion facilitator family transporter [Gammaproteobacteria bacterium]
MHKHSTAAEERYTEIRNITLIGSVVDGFLGIIKIVAGFVGSSQALIADGIHSLSDLVTDFMVLYAAKHGSREADEDHPYGHGRIETIMTVALGMALIAVAGGIGYDAAHRLFQPELLMHPGWMALVVAFISIISKEVIYQYTMKVANKLKSNLLRANAWHSRSDAISSIIVFIGVIGSMFGFEYLDALAAIGVALMIVKIGWDLVWNSVQELVDTALDPERVEEIRDVINSIKDVKALHMLRTRRMGHSALVDVHVQVAPYISVSEGHQISEKVRSALLNDIDEVTDVMVHIDPEDDEVATPCCQLPLREQLIEGLNKCWQGLDHVSKIEDITLHYLDGKIHVIVLLPISVLDAGASASEVSQAFSMATRKLTEISEVKVQFH